MKKILFLFVYFEIFIDRQEKKEEKKTSSRILNYVDKKYRLIDERKRERSEKLK